MSRKERREAGRCVLRSVLASLQSGISHQERHGLKENAKLLRRETAYVLRMARQTIKSL